MKTCLFTRPEHDDTDWGHHGPWERPSIHLRDHQMVREAIIQISPKGDLDYYYASPRGSGTFELDAPATAASVLMIEFVERFHEHIMTGKVYEYIKQQVDNQLEAIIETDKMCDRGQTCCCSSHPKEARQQKTGNEIIS